MTQRRVPKQLWDYGLVYEAQILSLVLQGQGKRPGLEQVTGKIIDISEYLDFVFYNLVCYYTGVRKLDTTKEPRALGRWLGISHQVGSDMCYWILTVSGKVIVNTTVQHVTRSDHKDPNINKQIDAFNTALTNWLDDPKFQTTKTANIFYLKDEDQEYGDLTGSSAINVDAITDNHCPAVVDKYIGAQLKLQLAGEERQATIIGWATNLVGNKIGRAHSNPWFNTRKFMVKFEDESIHRFRANQIAEAIYSQLTRKYTRQTSIQLVGNGCNEVEENHHIKSEEPVLENHSQIRGKTTLEKLFEEDGKGQHIQEKKTPLPSRYKPELDITKELDDKMSSRYRQLIGILRWAIELGRVDILYKVSIMSQYQAAPRIGHLEGLYCIFGHLKKRIKQKILFDPTNVKMDETCFQANADWTEFYGDVAEELPIGMPEPRGKPVVITCFVDSNHAGNTVTRQSHTGILIFVQNAPIIFYSKRQNTVKTSAFGSKFVAMRIAKEMIVALRYKLRMFGVPIDRLANMLCNNQGVVQNTSILESVLNKKHVLIANHMVREAAAAGILRDGKQDTETNLADLFTKQLSQAQRNQLLACIVYGPYLRDKWTNELEKRKEERQSRRRNKEEKT